MYTALIGLGLNFLQQFIASLTKAKAPQNVIDAVTAAALALEQHWNDEVTKENLEAQRG